MHRHDPWSVIAGPPHSGTLSTRRVDSTHPQNLFWARNDAGAIALVLKWDQAAVIPKVMPRIKGLVVEPGENMVKLVLQDQASRDVFQTLCEDLVEALRPIHSLSEAIDALFERLVRWQKLLDRGKKGLLTESQKRGLFAEVQFLSRELFQRFGAQSVGMWTGPEGTTQDFQFGTRVIEVKSRSASGAPVISISSADQLWAPDSRLHLFVYSIGQLPLGSGGHSLRSLIDAVRHEVGLGDWRIVFEEKLLEVGYMDLPEYAEIEYAISEPMIFEVTEGFPRIVPPLVPGGVSSVSYQLHLEDCIPYSVPMDWDSAAEA